MSCALERVSTRQTSKAATCLPLELQQLVFSDLDVKSFFAARKVCKYWNFASTDAVPLAKQLRKLPILPPVQASDADPNELENLFDEAAHTLMIGVKPERAWDTPGSLTRPAKMGFPITPRVVATSSGDRTVTLSGREIALFDTSGEMPRCISQRPLNDLKETIGSGPWLKVQPNSYNELALSSDGRLLAVAQERTIQIYDLLAEPDSFSINRYASSATGHYICGLDFEQDDHVLRVRLSGKGTVLYLGTPAERRGSNATMEHWKSKAGLKHTFLDSSLLSILDASTDPGQMVRISGVQILKLFEDGWLFAGQRHGGGESSHYILGHVKTSVLDNTEVLAAESRTVTVLARLESYLSSWDFTLEASFDCGVGIWENMPSAHEHHPRFTISADNSFLALAERDKKRIRPAPLTQLFVYRLPQLSAASMARVTPDGQDRWVVKCESLGKLESEQKGIVEQAAVVSKKMKWTIPRIPLCLSTLQGDVTDLAFTTIDRRTSSISATTVETTRTWLLHEM
ncbi:hypothetical protein CLAFUW4_00675 [Fulvia fulva]|uniref:F-box domain-containing protein n=1 Tax=Passalora fulva TaxID=5499 RepID=A0A9Q8P2G2_PASFU|nr:uncharacterized protein CLAFUR5_00678 [Fulvia fulva]KAK4634392.1 hypothetical protein CLAFUR4_00676 [Fulvia fulva]KAK4637883.1 hypothetical protein CLAFUR0_00677 [Fulvia fulva]UJO10933.1 hypothetical protein CLAFUR5_00678 [Fulvia fulva]WPV09907.1 hypothetical protein CLAFUW4_00675 [Fulvia fulva]WPV23661.1 hypothetical protein CLAFUW7_00680 [Fulvia fulva]